MPIPKNRGKVLKKRTVTMPGGRYKRCDIMEKAGPRGGKVVCGPTKKKRPAKPGGTKAGR